MIPHAIETNIGDKETSKMSIVDEGRQGKSIKSKRRATRGAGIMTKIRMLHENETLTIIHPRRAKAK